MSLKIISFAVVLGFISTAAKADEQSTEAAVGGGIGGALGGAIGAEIDGRSGAIIGAGVGAAIGAAIATEDEQAAPRPGTPVSPEVTVTHSTGASHPNGYHCPPGQAKKGRC